MSIARVSAILAVIFVAVSVWIIVTPIDQILPEATNHAGDIDFLFKFMLVASTFIFLIVQGFLLYFALRYRRKSEDAPEALGANIHGNTRLEIVWSVIPAVFLVVLTGMSYKVYADIITPHADAQPITVLAYQFNWSCEYPNYPLRQAPYMLKEDGSCHLPLGQQLTVSLQAQDVIHSFWVPEFRVKQDAVPGYTTRLHFMPTRATVLPDGLPDAYYKEAGQTRPTGHRDAGYYRLVCSEFCGSNHSRMWVKLYVWPQAMFKAWALSQMQAQSGGGNLANVSFSKDIEQGIIAGHCQGCHLGGAMLGGLNLSNYAGLLKGGNVVPGPVFKPGDHAHSVIWQITQPNPPWPGGNRMPLGGGGGYLTDAQLKTIAAWIDQGAKNN